MGLGEVLKKKLNCDPERSLIQQVSKALSRTPHEKITFLSQLIRPEN
jgi:hypothetical protein